MVTLLGFLGSLASTISCGCFIVGAIGYTHYHQTVQNVPWITADQNGVKAWFGLSKFFTDTNDFFVDVQGHTTYSSDQCTSDFCDVCEKDGIIAFALVVASAVFAFVTASLLGASNFKSAFVSSIVPSVCGLIGFSFFMHDCLGKIHDDTGLDLNYGTGAILTIIGFLLEWACLALSLLGMILGAVSS